MPAVSTPSDQTKETRQIRKEILVALKDGRKQRVANLVQKLHPADMADVLERARPQDWPVLLGYVKKYFDTDVLTYLDDAVRDRIVEQWGAKDVADAIKDMDSDDAVSVLEDLDDDEQKEILAAVPLKERVILEQALSYPEDSAGRLMQKDVAVVPEHWNVGQVVDYMRESKDLPDVFYDVFVVDPKFNLKGAVRVSKLLRAKRNRRVSSLMRGEVKSVAPEADQEEVAHMFRQYGLVDAPVLDEKNRLLGVVMVDDVLSVIDEEATEDLTRMAGVSEASIYSAITSVFRDRFSWLFVNLITAIAASAVIAQFEGTIEKVVTLAVLMPIVASMGGNAGMQTLTVAVRALALRELTSTNTRRVLMKEVLIGTLNGIFFAVIMAGAVWLWLHDIKIALVAGAAMVVNLFVAGLSGMIIPVMLNKAGIDPAVASSVLLTTVTDVVGFFAFLGMAAYYLF